MYSDYSDHFDKLSVKDRGHLITAIFDYANGKEPSKLSSKADMLFSIITKQMERDNAKYNKRCETNRANGAKGGRPRKTEKTDGFSAKPTETLNDTYTYTDSETYSDTYSYPDPYSEAAAPGKGSAGTKEIGEDAFMEFWKAYPKHISMNTAKDAYYANIRSKKDHSELMELLDKWKRSEDWSRDNGRFIKRADSFLTDLFPTRDEPTGVVSSFDADEFYNAALRRSYLLSSEVLSRAESAQIKEDGCPEEHPPESQLYDLSEYPYYAP